MAHTKRNAGQEEGGSAADLPQPQAGENFAREAAALVAGQARQWRLMRRLVHRTIPMPEKCEACGRKPLRRSHLHTDHDHVTGQFRGYVCRQCNLAMGLMADDPTRLRRLAAYLTRAKR